MTGYVDIIDEAVDYIESNIGKPLATEEIAGIFNISAFHFNRLFSALSGISLKRYVMGRKLSHALHKLRTTDETILSIALDLGFEYPEVFSRAFKRHYGLSPSAARSAPTGFQEMGKASIIQRNIVNLGGSLVVKAGLVHRESLRLRGASLVVNTGDPDFPSKITAVSQRFMTESEGDGDLDSEAFYSVVKCQGRGDGIYDVFVGRACLDNGAVITGGTVDGCSMGLRGGWYASFAYDGSMDDVRLTFEADLYRWLSLKGVHPDPEGSGMITVYGGDYEKVRKVRILIPILRPDAPMK